METLRKKPKIKICGITSREEAEYLNEANAEYAGFVLYEKSRRKVNFSLAAEAMEALKEGILKVAVVVDPSLALVREIEQQKFDIIQVHGTLCREVREGAKLPVFRAVNISDPTMWKAFTKEEIAAGGCIAGYVADGAGYGGGVGVDWKNLGEEVRRFAGNTQLMLAGGLTEENVREAIRHVAPDIVDVSSGVEENGIKSREKIIRFVRKVRENEQ